MKLNGSEKQIVWANEIRDKRLTEIAERRESENHTIERWSQKLPSDKWAASIERHKANLVELDNYEQYVRSISNAAYFIANRDYNLDFLLIQYRATQKRNKKL